MGIQVPLVAFTVLAGMGSALYLFAIIGHQFAKDRIDDKTVLVAAVAAVILLVVGGLASVLHLSHAERILEALNHPTSGIFLEALFLGILVVLIAVFVAVLKRTGATSGATKVVGGIGGVVALVYLYVLGQSYMMTSQPFWNTPLLPLSYATTAAVSGAALYLLIAAALRQVDGAVKLAGLVLGCVGVLSALVTAIYGIASGIGMGEQAASMWGLVVVVGSLLPAVCGFMAWRNPKQALTLAVVALIGALIGSAGLRCVMWLTEAPVQNLFAMPRY